ncbi:lasso peptide biosynthesis B2 protein [Hyphococcus luteus]|uniref:Microcin J25-processing protein McjB C-terminal domain-containing protein n=1 Tax=Hyphococcus luteus TaxID=2058213 RepID=A0A2S7K3X7_9PROT|nr:lasso peptide biosynthesis B2 protein [Marinicaulis flavus]PQA87186.1 hypothetical protein CW354_14195 [Marinicaulis flavus]
MTEATGKMRAEKQSGAPELFLTPQTFTAMTDGVLVFLDLKKDRYSCLEPRCSAAVAGLLGLNAPREEGADETGASGETPAVDELVRDLLERGLVTRDARKGKRAEMISHTAMLRETPGYLPGEGPYIQLRHVAAFFRALLVTSLLLGFSDISHIAARIRRRRRREKPARRCDAHDERIRKLIEIFRVLRPLGVAVKDRCLFNSLLLIEFLAAFGIFPEWRFGVRVHGFHAHCWVQEGELICDDQIQNLAASAPIMSV